MRADRLGTLSNPNEAVLSRQAGKRVGTRVVNIDFWTALFSAVGLALIAATVYVGLDLIFKRGCLSIPGGYKYGIMSLKLAIFSATYTFGIGGASYGATRLAALTAVGNYSFRYGAATALVSCVTIVLRRIVYERSNWSYFSRLPQPGGSVAAEIS